MKKNLIYIAVGILLLCLLKISFWGFDVNFTIKNAEEMPYDNTFDIRHEFDSDGLELNTNSIY